MLRRGDCGGGGDVSSKMVFSMALIAIELKSSVATTLVLLGQGELMTLEDNGMFKYM